MSSKVCLESFETEASDVSETSADYERGFTDGVEASKNSTSSQLSHAVEDIAGTLSDMTFGFEEARLHIIDRIRPLLVQVSEFIIPEIARTSFAAHLADIITRDFETTIQNPVQIFVTPEIANEITKSLACHTDNFVIIGDADLTDGQARLKQSDVHLMIDLPALVLDLQSALNGLESTERSQSNG